VGKNHCTPSNLIFFLVFVYLFIWPVTAWAHVESGQAGGFVSGLRHPVSGLDHVLAMVAVGLWGAQLGPPAVWMLPVAFPMMMAFGGMLGLMGLPVPGIEIGIAVSGIVLGALIIWETQIPLAAALVVVALFAIFHGHAHGTELMPGQSAILYSLGFVIATGMLHAAGIGIGVIHRWQTGRLALRFAGSLIMVGGLYFLWRAIA
jgi:urease accessory protein